MAGGYAPQGLIVNGIYDDLTIEDVEQLQTIIDVPVTGEFDEPTKIVYGETTGLDMDELTANIFQGETVAA